MRSFWGAALVAAGANACAADSAALRADASSTDVGVAPPADASRRDATDYVHDASADDATHRDDAPGDGHASSADATSRDAGSTKKGVGTGFPGGEAQLEALGVHWYYNWGPAPQAGLSFRFVPMIFSPNDVGQDVQGSTVLGFNEPDNAAQANVSVSTALAAWPDVVTKAPTVGAPAMAGDPVTGSWFPQFMAAKPTVSFIPIHWYKGVSSTLFISDVTAVITTYNLPVWVTEFAPQYDSEAEASPDQYSQAEVNQFITETVAWMEQNPLVERYAWHTAPVGTSSLLGDAGISETGMTYANAH